MNIGVEGIEERTTDREQPGARYPKIAQIRLFPQGCNRTKIARVNGGLGAGNGADLLEEPVNKSFPVDRLRVARTGEADLDGEDVVSVESFVNVQQSCKAGAKKARDDQQRSAQPDFKAYQGLAKAKAGASFGDGMTPSVQRFLWVAWMSRQSAIRQPARVRR